MTVNPGAAGRSAWPLTADGAGSALAPRPSQACWQPAADHFNLLKFAPTTGAKRDGRSTRSDRLFGHPPHRPATARSLASARAARVLRRRRWSGSPVPRRPLAPPASGAAVQIVGDVNPTRALGPCAETGLPDSPTCPGHPLHQPDRRSDKAVVGGSFPARSTRPALRNSRSFKQRRRKPRHRAQLPLMGIHPGRRHQIGIPACTATEDPRWGRGRQARRPEDLAASAGRASFARSSGRTLGAAATTASYAGDRGTSDRSPSSGWAAHHPRDDAPASCEFDVSAEERHRPAQPVCAA